MAVELGAPHPSPAVQPRAALARVDGPPPGGHHGPTGRLAARVLAALVLATAAAFFLIPLVWLLLAPTKTDHQLVVQSPFAFGSLARVATSWNHLVAYEGGAILVWLRNSAIYSFSGTAIAILVGIPAGYGLAVTQFVGRKTLLVATLVVMIMPSTALVLPLFLEMNAFHLIGNAFSVILPFAFFPFGVYLAYIYFSSTIPPDLLAASRIDGCTEWKTFRFIAMPLATPVIALVAFFDFVASWNNFFLPFVMLPSSNQYPVQVGLENLLSSTPAFNPTIGGSQLAVYRPELALAILVAIAPVLIVFLFAQRALVAGLLAGATKE
ncbi:MAG: sugar transporter permease [Acidimicrobiaceae bacterium]|jgi:multiple sugar transport system permease protein|nr:sugar transporter permease [Acidimicrobiaceae bacterium]